MYFLIFQLEGMLKLSINFRRISAYKSYAYNKKRMWLLRFKLLEECAIIIIFAFDIEFTLLVPYDNNSMKKKITPIDARHSSQFTTYNTKISPDFLVWKFCGKAQFLQSFGPFTQNSKETVSFHKILAPQN